MKPLVALFVLMVLPVLPAHAEWRLESGAAFAEPSETNSNIVGISFLCGDPVQFEIYTDSGPVLPKSGGGEADYFYMPGRVEAEIDGIYFPLVAAGSGDAVVMFGEGVAADNYMAELPPELMQALSKGMTLTIGFDVTPEPNEETDSQFETFARFSLAGAASALEGALKDCR